MAQRPKSPAFATLAVIAGTALLVLAGSITAYTTDLLHRVSSVTAPTGRVTSFTYDAMGNRTGITGMTYNAAEKLATVAEPRAACCLSPMERGAVGDEIKGNKGKFWLMPFDERRCEWARSVIFFVLS